MTARTAFGVIATLLMTAGISAQPVPGPAASRYVDPVNGLSLDQAVARALEQEPALRAVRTRVDAAEGEKLQAGLRPNPSVMFERREEPGGTDSQTMIELEWPLDLFRRGGRVAVAEREVAAARFAAADRVRLLEAEVRLRYGDLLAAVRDVRILDDLVDAVRRQFELLRSRVGEGAAPPLERDLLDVELRRLEAERLLQVGTADAAVFELKRVLGLEADAPVMIRDTLEQAVLREPLTSTAAADAAAVLEQRPDVQEASARAEAAGAKIERARADGRFDVMLFASYMRMDAAFPYRAFTPEMALAPIRARFDYVSAGATVTIPLLNRNQGEVAAAQAERAGAAAMVDAARLAARTELESARARDTRARQAVQVYSGGVEALARQNLTVVAQSHELGRVTVFDVLAEQRRFLEVERAYTAVLREAYDARTALERALGGVR